MTTSVVVPPFTEAPSTVVGGTPTSVFEFDFPFWDAADVLVYVDGEQLDPDDYTVTGLFLQDGESVEGGYGSGEVTLNTPVTDCTVTIDRSVVSARETQFSRSGPLPPGTLNADLNRITARQQDQERRLTTAEQDLAGVQAAAESASASAASAATSAAASEAARDVAEDARDAAEAAAAEAGNKLDKGQALADLSDKEAALANIKATPMVASVAEAQSRSFSAAIKSIRTQYYAPTYTTPDTLVGGAEYARVSKATIDSAGYPALAYFRSSDRFMPDGTTDATNGGYWLLNQTRVKPEVLGAPVDGVLEDSAAVQAAIDYLYIKCAGVGGAVEFTSGRTYILDGIVWKPGVTGLSDGYTATQTESSAYWNGPRLKHKVGATDAMIRNDQTIGNIRGTSNVDGQPQRYLSASFRGLTFVGSLNAAQFTTNCDLVRMWRAWNVQVVGCSFFASRGFGLALLDCNNIRTHGNSAVYAPIIVDDCADCRIDFEAFGGNTVCNSIVWITGAACAGNLFTGFAGNNRLQSASGTGGFVAATVDTGADTFTFAGAHGWTTGLPVVLDEASTAPTGLLKDRTYYVIVVDAVTVKLAIHRYNALAGTAINITTAGSSVALGVGHDANIVLNHGASRNALTGFRSDQAYGDGVLLLGAPGNILTGFSIFGSGMDNATAKAGIRLTQGSTDTAIGDGIVNGVKLQSGAMLANQKHGIKVDDAASMEGLTTSTGFRSHNHTVANSVAGAENFYPPKINPRRIFLGSDRFEALSGSPAIATVGGGRRNAWLFDAAADEIIGTEIVLPPCRTLSIRLGVVNAGAGSGNVAWALNLGGFSLGATINAADQFAPATTIAAAGAQDVLSEVVISSGNISALFDADALFMRVKRLGTDAGDTLANDAGLIYVIVEPDP